jgi:hypothetical protein
LLKKISGKTSALVEPGFDPLYDALLNKFEEQFKDEILKPTALASQSIHVTDWVESPQTLLRELEQLSGMLLLDIIFEKRCLTVFSVSLREDNVDVISNAVRASSEDHTSQSIEQALEHSSHSFWSSKGSEDPDTGEFLEFDLGDPFCIIYQFIIHPFKASFQRGMPTYAPKFCSISVGLDKNSIYYSSPLYACENVNRELCFTLPCLLVAGFVRVNFFGRHETQPADNLYYTVMQQVKVKGLPFGMVSYNPLLGL